MESIEIGDSKYNSNTRELQQPSSVVVRLTTKESQLLEFLHQRVDETVPNKDILMSIWGNDEYTTMRSMNVYVTRLRNLFKGDSRVQILNVHGRGYKMVVS